MMSIEIRRIIVEDAEEGMSVKEISRVLRVSSSAIYALLRRKQETGSIEPGYKGKCGRPSKLTQEQLNAMEELVNQRPDITLEEIQQKLDLPIKKSQINNLLHKMGFRLKKDDSCLRTKAV